MRYDAEPSRDTMATLRNLDSLSSTLTMRSNTCGGGPSIDSNVTVAPPPAMAKDPPPAPPLAQPPKAQANPSSAAAIAARAAVRRPLAARNRVADVSLITPCDIVK